MAAADGKSLAVGLAGLGAVGMALARRLRRGCPGLRLVAVAAARSRARRARLAAAGIDVAVVTLAELPRHADVVVEAVPAAHFRDRRRAGDRRAAHPRAR